MADRDAAARYFSHFSRITKRESPLYSALCSAIADDDELLALVAPVPERQPPANILLGAVHFLLLRGADHPLAAYYASVGGTRAPDGEVVEVFRDFCRAHDAELLPHLVTGRVQTNEVRRATFLMPGLAWIAARAGTALATVEVGAAAGLLTLWDRYAYDYGEGRVVGESSLTLSCELRGKVPDLTMPARAWSAGIDIAPVPVDDRDASDWLRAMVWPDQTERLARLEAAIDIARAHPPVLVEGDGIDLIGNVVATAPAGATVVVHHSFALNQVSPDDRHRFDEALRALASSREIYLLAIEWAGPEDPTELRAGRVLESEVPRKTLARVHHHGEWLDWVA